MQTLLAKFKTAAKEGSIVLGVFIGIVLVIALVLGGLAFEILKVVAVAKYVFG